MTLWRGQKVNQDDRSVLQHCYEQLKKVINGSLESFEIVHQVQKYREYWKPDDVKIILLAESHVYTTKEDFNLKLDTSRLDLPGYPDRYVRFVYCLGYGESGAVTGPVRKNTGTPQFWRLFYSCCNPIRSPQDFNSILKTKAGIDSLANKINLLKKMKQLGIWLLDASIIGINDKNKPLPGKYDELILLCWKEYISHIVKETNPLHVICIGKKVGKILEKHIEELTGNNPTILPQPGAYLTKQELKELHESCYSVCSKYCRDASKYQPDIPSQNVSSKKPDVKTINRAAQNTKKANIKSLAKSWMINQLGKILIPRHVSKYYIASESWTKQPAWWVQFSKNEIWSEQYEFVHWLLQKEPGATNFYYLKVPTSYLQEHELDLGKIKEKFSLFLSAQKDRTFFRMRTVSDTSALLSYLEELKDE